MKRRLWIILPLLTLMLLFIGLGGLAGTTGACPECGGNTLSVSSTADSHTIWCTNTVSSGGSGDVNITFPKLAPCPYTTTASHSGGTATCTQKAVCSVCDQSYGNLLSHTGGTATCTLQAVCTLCSQSYGDLQPHTNGTATCTQQATCSVCGHPYGDLLPHTGGTATCILQALCNECNQPYGAFAPHAGGTATCTQQATCNVCNQPYGAFAPHNEEPIPGVPATCSSAGLTGGKKCSVCSEVLATQTAVNKLPHTEAAIPGYPATCTAAGLTEGKKCSVCGEALKAQAAIPASHNYAATGTAAATCIAGGYTDYRCSRCGSAYTGGKTTPLGHRYGAWSPKGDETHGAGCERTGCGHIGAVNCALQPFTVREQDIAICPVCGETSGDIILALVEGVKLEASEGTLPGGNQLLYFGELTEGLGILCVAIENAGTPEPLDGSAWVRFPADVFPEGVRLLLVDETGAETELLYTVEDSILSFKLPFPSSEDGAAAVMALILTVYPD